MKARTLIALAAVSSIVAGGVVGGYLAFAGGGAKQPAVPKAWRNTILEKATKQGVIDGYRLAEVVPGQHVLYTADDGDISLYYLGCVGNASCPARPTTVDLQYRARAAEDARTILHLAQALYGGKNGMHVHFTLVT